MPVAHGFVGAADPDIERLAAVHAALGAWLGRQTDQPEDVAAVATLLTGHAVRWEGAHGPLTIRVNRVGDTARVEVARALDNRRTVGPMTIRLHHEVGGLDGRYAQEEQVVVHADLGLLLLRCVCPLAVREGVPA